MKPLFIILTAIASFFSSTSKADMIPASSEEAVKAFQSRFATANAVTWSASNNLYKASFTINDQQAVAYFDASGNFMALTRNVVSTQLPLTLQASLRTNYPEMWITDLFELSNDGGVHYYVTLENADQKIVLKSNTTNWSVFKKAGKV